MVAALSLIDIYPGFSTGNKVHKYYLEYGLWVELGCIFVEPNKRGGWLSLRWFRTTNYSTRAKSWMSDLSILARFFSSALMLALFLRDRMLHGVAPSRRSRPLLCLHYCSFHLMFLLWVTSMLPCLTCIHDIPTKPSLGCPPCLSFACGWIKDVGGAPCDASWCMHG
jgi:hypothetical protein